MKNLCQDCMYLKLDLQKNCPLKFLKLWHDQNLKGKWLNFSKFTFSDKVIWSNIFFRQVCLICHLWVLKSCKTRILWHKDFCFSYFVSGCSLDNQNSKIKELFSSFSNCYSNTYFLSKELLGRLFMFIFSKKTLHVHLFCVNRC